LALSVYRLTNYEPLGEFVGRFQCDVANAAGAEIKNHDFSGFL
jgi:hypothetical protein